MNAVSHDWNQVRSFEFSNGRYFTEEESAAGRNVVLIGAAIGDGLFGDMDPLGRMIKVKGHKLKVIGMFKREGESLLQSTSLDNQMVIPVNYARNLVDVDDDRFNPTILVKARNGASLEELENELKGVMRASRKLRPAQEDNFALNKITLLSNGLNAIFSVISIAGWIIGGLATLVGGFCIANIMYVSVKERTHIIGIQKSLGAKSRFILTQFLVESIALTLIGGFAGIILVYATTFGVSKLFGFEVVLSLGNFITGCTISIIIGVVFGIMPAYSAARLDPVEAIRSNI